jgi:hypothetical protein
VDVEGDLSEGSGFRSVLPLEKILLNMDEGETKYTLDASINDPRNWRFYLLQPTVRHLVAVALPYDDHVMRYAQMGLLVMPLEDVIHTRIGTSPASPDARRILGSSVQGANIGRDADPLLREDSHSAVSVC